MNVNDFVRIWNLERQEFRRTPRDYPLVKTTYPISLETKYRCSKYKKYQIKDSFHLVNYVLRARSAKA